MCESTFFHPGLAQLVEQSTVVIYYLIICLYNYVKIVELSIGHLFESGNPEFLII